MITVANRIYVNAEFSDAFEKVFRERARLVDEMPGFISNQVLRPVNEGDPYIVFTLWNSREDFMNWVRSDAFIKGHAQSGTLPKEAYFKPNVLEMHEVLQDSSRPELQAELKGGPFKMH
jgi:heme-degrading monooxygenase HmoA